MTESSERKNISISLHPDTSKSHTNRNKFVNNRCLYRIAIISPTNKTTNISEFEADKYDIERKKDHVLLNISVINNKDFTNSNVKIDVTANNLLGQKKEIKILEIVENNSVSYVALTSISNFETLNYDIKVTLNDGSSKNFKYTHQFYIE